MSRRRVVAVRDPYFPPGVRAHVSAGGVSLTRQTQGGRQFHFSHHHWEGLDKRDWVKQTWFWIWEVVMKRKLAADLPSLMTHASVAGLLEHFPNIASFMTTAVFEDTKERRDAPTITLWCLSGQWKASVKDKAEGLVMFLNAETLPELLQLIELYVLEAEAPWKYDELGSPQKGKRVERK